MINLSELLQSVVSMLRSCPEIATEVGSKENVVSYTDVSTSETNSVTRVIYSMPSGSVMVAWMLSGLASGDMEGWAHQCDIYVRAMRRHSPLLLLNAVIDGTPEGTDLRWRYQCVHPEIMPVEIQEIVRVVDEEGIDYYVIRTLFREKGDTTYAVPG